MPRIDDNDQWGHDPDEYLEVLADLENDFLVELADFVYNKTGLFFVRADPITSPRDVAYHAYNISKVVIAWLALEGYIVAGPNLMREQDPEGEVVTDEALRRFLDGEH